MKTTNLVHMTCLAGACLVLAGCGRDGKRAAVPSPDINRQDPAGATQAVVVPDVAQASDRGPAAVPAGSPRTERTTSGVSAPQATPTVQAEASASLPAERAAAAGDPGELAQWIEQAAERDYATAAAGGDARAQLLHGLSLLRKDLVMVQDRVPLLSALPVIGEKWFAKTQYFISEDADPARVAEAQAWIARARAQHFAPAVAAEQLFRGRADTPIPAAPATTSSDPADAPRGRGP